MADTAAAPIALAGLAPRLVAETTGAPSSIIDIDATGGTIAFTAPGGTNLFCDPRTARLTATAPRLLMPLDGDGWLRARVRVDFAENFDVGALLAWIDQDRWAKLCFERAPDGNPMVVSVVNRGRSDDANAFVVAPPSVHLRLARLDHALAFHASLDGRVWTLIRYFEIGRLDGLRIGFTAHSSRGTGVRSVFSEIGFATATLADIRGPL